MQTKIQSMKKKIFLFQIFVELYFEFNFGLIVYGIIFAPKHN